MSSPLSIQVSKGGKTIHAALPHDAILLDLIVACRDSSEWGADTEASHFDWDKAKFIAKGRILKCGEHDEEPVAHLDGMKVLLQVPTVKDIVDLRDSSAAAKAQEDRLAAQRRAAVPARSTKVSQTDSKYTFMRIEPLPGLRNPERSREFLVKLAADPGIKAAMRKHEFTGMYNLMRGKSCVRRRVAGKAYDGEGGLHERGDHDIYPIRVFLWWGESIAPGLILWCSFTRDLGASEGGLTLVK